MATIDQRTTRDGDVRWRVRVRRRGIVETASFTSRAGAEHWAKQVELAIENGVWIAEVESDDLRFDQLVDLFVATEAPNSDMRRQLGWWRRQLGSESVAVISKRRILRLRESLQREVSSNGHRRRPATANRYVSALSATYSWALRKGWIDTHPVRGITALNEGEEKSRYLSDEERDRLLESCSSCGGPRLHALITLALSTGARRGELLALRWSDIDLRRGSINFRSSAGKVGRFLPLADPAMETLRPLSKVRRIGGDEVFADRHGRVGFPRRDWEVALRDARIEDFRFLDLRHSAAAYLALCGASLADIAEFLGHKSLRGVQRYAHLVDQRSQTGVERMHKRLFDGGQ